VGPGIGRCEGGVVRDVGARALDARDGEAKQCTMHCAPMQTNTVQGSLAQSCHRQLIRLSEYRMCQRATAVDQPPISPVFNTADYTLDGFDVSGIQGPSLRVKWNRRHPTGVG